MSSDDTPAAPTPRFVPTLTQVIASDATPALGDLPTLPSLDVPDDVLSPAAKAALVAAATHAAARPSGTDSPAPSTADAVLAQIGPDLERLISEAIARVLHEQMLGLNARVRKAVAEVVHETVTKALVQGTPGTKTGENP